MATLRERYTEAQTSDERERIKRSYTLLRARLRMNGDNLADQAVDLSEPTQQLRNSSQLLKQLNPTVWNAVLQTAKFSAFFRYIKTSNPASWRAFLNQLRPVAIQPLVKTPTEWKKRTS
jgi:hypothetical protein